MSFAHNILLVGSGTAVSRVLGFIRDILLANLLGAGAVADAFVVAFRLPNLFRRLFTEGAFNASFVPVFAELTLQKGVQAAQAFAGQVLTGMMVFVGIVTLAAEIFMEPLVFAMAPGFFKDSAEAALTVYLSRLAFPFLGFCLIAAVFSALLNAREKFGLAAYAPVVLNVVLIAALVLAAHFAGANAPLTAALVSAGVSLAGLAQVIWCFWGAGFRDLRLERPRMSGAMRTMLALSVPGLIAGGITQINGFIGSLVGSGAPSAVSQLYYADRVYQLPLGLVSTALGLVLLPKLARMFAAGNHDGAQNLQNAAVESALFLTLPAAVALGVCAMPITAILFQHGAFDAAATRATALALQAFALGLPAFSLAKALQPSFFALQKMRAPLIIALIGGGLDLALSLALFPGFGAQGIAWAAAAAGWLNAFALAALLLKSRQWRLQRDVLTRILLMLISAILTGVMLLFAVDVLAPWLDVARSPLAKLAALSALVFSGLAFYLATALVFKCVNWRAWQNLA